MGLKVYSYGALAPSNLNLVQEQMSLAHQYSNVLTEIELERRKEYRNIYSLHSDVLPFTQRVQALEALLIETRTQNRAEGERVKVKDVFAQLKEARAELKAAKQRIQDDPKLLLLVQESEARTVEAVKKARAASGLYWGTYLICETAAASARQGTFDPKIKKWTGHGHLAVQIQKGLDTTNIFSSKNLLVWIDPVKPAAWQKGVLGKRMAERTTVHMRIFTNGREPVWADIPIDMHRPLPPGTIKWAHLIRRPMAGQFRWMVQFTIDAVETAKPERAPKAAGIHVGWRLLDNGDLRVAMLVDEEGKTSALHLPAKLLSKELHTQKLQSIRSRNMDEKRLKLVRWLTEEGRNIVNEKPEHVMLWRSPGRIVKLLKEYGTSLPPDLKKELEEFLKQDRHLWQWQDHERDKVYNQRRYLYRQWAVEVARAYTRIGIEDFDLREFARRGPAVEDETPDARAMNKCRRLANIAGFREVLKNACGNLGSLLEKSRVKGSSKICHACGEMCEFDASAHIEHTCEHCGTLWDQDENAGMNLVTALLLRAAENDKAVPEKAEPSRLRRFKRKMVVKTIAGV